MSTPRNEPEPCIGILDSGVGGLSVLREIRKIVPGAPLRYVGDSAWCPYGTRTAEAIQERVLKISDNLIGHGASVLVIACNSATIHAVEMLRNTIPIPIIGMEPGVKPAAAKTRSGVVGILATEASIAGEKFHRLLDIHASGIRVITQPCPRFVELVEAGEIDGSEVEEAVSEIVDPLLEAGCDVLVLGCTHYPFLKEAIRAAIPESVELIDTGPAVARRVKEVAGAWFGEGDGSGKTIVETSGDLDLLRRLLPILLPEIKCDSAQFSERIA